ncbi:MAG: tRNA (adenosine(37)-N6)-dimethylallyltransferase MiaA [Desulfobacteraceae bacterium]|nr:MAG: tRNA (adenosine(37)-N6)-dimethylallyltransferase MiaA [Desulfobacteraceae bacterium]
MEEKPKIIVIAGPTASGKTSLAIELALAIGGEIVNADSMQVYRGMDVGTAKPDSHERSSVPHHLMDVVDPDEDFNAALYRSLALPVIRGILSRGRVPFVVGGTGLYIRVLLGGVVPSPPIDPKLRRGLQDEIARKGPASFHERLKELDPESARRIHPHDRVRILRALEIIYLSKKRLSALVENHRFKDNPFNALKICLQIEREQLYHRINERCVRMIESGLAAETASLLKKGYSPALKSMTGLGYRHMVGVLEGRWDMDAALRKLQSETRRYAKRQMTWFRADPENIWVRPGDVEGISRRIREFLGEGEAVKP